MSEEKKKVWRPVADLKVKLREYTDSEGKTKGVWLDVGTIMSTPHGSGMFITINALPVNFDGKINIFKREPKEGEMTSDDDRFLGEIPF